jgi:hypothetical protein
MGAMSAGRSPACNDFIPTACVHNMRTWGGGVWHVYLDVGQERRGRSMTACWALPACQEGRTLHLLQQQPWAQHVHVERTQNRAVQYGRKSIRGLTMEHAEPHGSSPGQRTTSWHAGFFAGGLGGTGRGSTYVEAQHRAANGQPKVNRGHVTGACWAPRAVHWDRWIHCACCFNRGPTWTPSRPPACQNHTGLVWRYWTVCRRLRIDLFGPHQAV